MFKQSPLRDFQRVQKEREKKNSTNNDASNSNVYVVYIFPPLEWKNIYIFYVILSLLLFVAFHVCSCLNQSRFRHFFLSLELCKENQTIFTLN